MQMWIDAVEYVYNVMHFFYYCACAKGRYVCIAIEARGHNNLIGTSTGGILAFKLSYSTPGIERCNVSNKSRV